VPVLVAGTAYALRRPREGDQQMPRLEHVALWTTDIERLCDFYVRHFGAVPGAPYLNPLRGFESRFLSFGAGARLELMHSARLPLVTHAPGAERHGLTHFAISVGSEAQVDARARQLRADGHVVLDGPRRTGDGYYEAVVLDPDGNRVEITA
jgi:lactoylglutathione lyase